MTGPEWTFTTTDPIIATPLVVGDTIIVRTTRQIIAVDGRTRTVQWAYDSPGTIKGTGSPISNGELIFAPEGSNPLLALSSNSGRLAWEYCFSPNAPGCTHAPEGIWIEDLVTSGHEVIISDFGGVVTAFDSQTGKQLWHNDQIGGGGPALAMDDDTVYFEKLELNQPTGKLLAVDFRSGEIRWQFALDDVMGRLTTGGRMLYFTTGVDKQSRLVAMGAASPEVKWKTSFAGAYPSRLNHIILSGETLYVGADSLMAFSAVDGEVLWANPNLHRLGKPVIYNNIVLARNEDTLYAVDRHTGEQIGQLHLDAMEVWRTNVTLDPALYGDLVLIPEEKTSLAAYRLTGLPR